MRDVSGLMPTAEVALRVGINRDTVRRRVRDGRLPPPVIDLGIRGAWWDPADLPPDVPVRPGMQWMGRARCADRPDLWCDTGDPTVRAAAADTCRTGCPVLTECRGWAADKQWSGVVIAGWAADPLIPRKPPWGRAKAGAP